VLIGLIGSMQFAGWVTSLLFLPALSDRIGRKKIVHSCVIFQFVLFANMYQTTSLTNVIVSMYFAGFCVTGTVIISYIYIRDFLPENERKLFGTLSNLIDGATLMWSSFYFMYFPYWKPLFMYTFAVQCFVIVGLLFIPESPIVLYETG